MQAVARQVQQLDYSNGNGVFYVVLAEELSWQLGATLRIVSRVRRSLKVMAFNANGIWRQRYEFCKHLQDVHIDVALSSEIHLKLHEMFLFWIITFIVLTPSQEEKAEWPLQ
jgi:hypothetical protein